MYSFIALLMVYRNEQIALIGRLWNRLRLDGVNSIYKSTSNLESQTDLARLN